MPLTGFLRRADEQQLRLIRSRQPTLEFIFPAAGLTGHRRSWKTREKGGERG